MERRNGIALWRQIADQIRLAIGTGEFAEKLPPEMALADRFGVNRHTVRGAIAALVQEGVLRAEQGRGTFVENRKRFAYPIGVRTRFSEGLKDQARERRGSLLGHSVEAADARIARGARARRGDAGTAAGNAERGRRPPGLARHELLRRSPLRRSSKRPMPHRGRSPRPSATSA